MRNKLHPKYTLLWKCRIRIFNMRGGALSVFSAHKGRTGFCKSASVCDSYELTKTRLSPPPPPPTPRRPPTPSPTLVSPLPELHVKGNHHCFHCIDVCARSWGLVPVACAVVSVTACSSVPDLKCSSRWWHCRGCSLWVSLTTFLCWSVWSAWEIGSVEQQLASGTSLEIRRKLLTVCDVFLSLSLVVPLWHWIFTPRLFTLNLSFLCSNVDLKLCKIKIFKDLQNVDSH